MSLSTYAWSHDAEEKVDTVHRMRLEVVFGIGYKEAGLRSRSRGRSWTRSESTVLPGVEVGTGVGKILPTPTPVRSRRIPTVNRQ